MKNLLLLFFLTTATAAFASDAAKLYQQHCAQCHHPDRLGAIGPALIPRTCTG